MPERACGCGCRALAFGRDVTASTPPAPLLCSPRSEKKFPWQNGIHFSDLKVLLPGAKIREAEAMRAQREVAVAKAEAAMAAGR